MNRIWNKIKQNWITVWLLVVAAAFTTFVAIAAYTEVSSVKRVVSTDTSPGKPFSSNCMRPTLTSHRLTADSYSVTVCNYDQDYPKNYSKAEITYTLTAELKVKYENQYRTFSELQGLVSADIYNEYVTRAANYSIKWTGDDAGSPDNVLKKFSADNNYKVTYGTGKDGNKEENQHLATRRSSTDTYEVKIDPADREQPSSEFYIFLTAEPDNAGLDTLTARLYGAKGKDSEANWTGKIQEASPNMIDYDFYNYIITGSGEGTLTLLWNEAYLKPNKFFLSEEGKTAAYVTGSELADKSFEIGNTNTTYGAQYAGWKYIQIEVNSAEKGRYEVQLYKTQENLTLTNPSQYVVCRFDKKAAESDTGD